MSPNPSDPPLPSPASPPVSSIGAPAFNAGRFADRRARVLEALGSDAMVLPAAPPLLRAGDSELPYRPDSELYYLTGCREPGAVLVLRGFADSDRELLFVRERDRTQEQWTGLRMGPDGAAERLGLGGARALGRLDDDLPGLLDGADRVHVRLGAHAGVQRLVEAALAQARQRGARKGTGPRGVIDPGGILDEMRLRKDPAEIEAIREAVRVSIVGFEAAFDVVGVGVGEWEVEAALLGAFRRAGAAGPAFAPIVASGTNACILHYIENNARIPGDALVLIDAGAEVGMYAGDLTRTVPASGRFTPAQKAVHEAVDAARRASIERIAPGVEIAEIHRVATRVLTEGLIEMGLLEGVCEELIEQGAHRRYFPHQTSHWLGLNTHDPGDYMVEGRSRRLEPGMVLTVEPGLYIAPPGFFGEGEEGGESAPPPDPGPFAGIGVRIEDDVLVTADGHEVLSRDLPT